MMTDCYQLLGIPATANEQEIRKGWRNKTKEVHPDVNPSPDAEKQFLLLTQAMETLLDPVKRLQHDRQFGYYEKPKNQDRNTKQHISEFQKTKAEKMVTAWSNDYDLAMKMREAQRRRVIKRHRRNVLFIAVGFALLLIAALCWLFGHG
jgi:DnaJ-class molecular chaperone